MSKAKDGDINLSDAEIADVIRQARAERVGHSPSALPDEETLRESDARGLVCHIARKRQGGRRLSDGTWQPHCVEVEEKIGAFTAPVYE